MRRRKFEVLRRIAVHAKTISFVGIFGLNALSQTLVSGWLASKDLKAFSVFALIIGLGSVLAFVDFGAGAMAQTNLVRYLATGNLRDIFFVKRAIFQSVLLSLLLSTTAIIVLSLDSNFTIKLVAVYLIFLGLTITTNTANNLIYAIGQSELALFLSRTSWIWTFLTIQIFSKYFENNLYQVPMLAIIFQFLLGCFSIMYCKIKKIVNDIEKVREISTSEVINYRREYRSLALITGTAGIPLMLSLHADRYVITLVNGSESIASLVAYGTLFSGSTGIMTFFFYKIRFAINFKSEPSIQQNSKYFTRIVIFIAISHLVFGQIAIYYCYPSVVSNIIMQMLYTVALLCFALTLRYQLHHISIRSQKKLARSVFFEAVFNLILTFCLAHYFGPLAGPLSTILAILFVQIPILYLKSPFRAIHSQYLTH